MGYVTVCFTLQGYTELRDTFAPNKAFLLGSSKAVLSMAAKAVGRRAGTAALTVRRLGIDYSFSRPPRQGPLLT